MSYVVDRMEYLGITGADVQSPLQYTGYELRDIRRKRIGRVQEIFTNVRGEPEYVKTRLGPVGMGRSVLIPVAAVEVDEASRALVLQ